MHKNHMSFIIKGHAMNNNLFLGFFAAFVLLSAQTSTAQTYPSKTINVIVPFAPGGGVDVLTRAIMQKLSVRWGQSIVVENKAGAGSVIGSSLVAKANPDGYTLLATVNQTMVGNRFLFKKLPYDLDKAFEPITLMVKADQLIVANSALPVNSLKEMVDLARSKPGTLNYGSFGNGSQPHLLFSLINEKEGIEVVHIPYNGITPNLAALVSGDVQVGSGSAAVVMPFINAGRIKPLAVASDSRIGQFPKISTTIEQGFPYAKVSIWYALFAPAGTPIEIVNEIRNSLKAVMTEPQFLEQQVISKGLTAINSDSKTLRDVIRKEVEETAAMVKAAGISPE